MSSEGHPGVLVEALITGIPTVVVASGSAAEVVAHGGGLVVEPNHSQLVEAMTSIASDSDVYNRLESEAIEARDFWGTEAVFEPLLDWLDDV